MTNPKKGTGLLLVWGDVPMEREEDFNHWYNEEHLRDQLSVPGFLNAARYEAVQYEALQGEPKHLACYELESPEVLNSEAQKRLIENPSEWTKRISYKEMADTYIQAVLEVVYPFELTQEVANSDMASALQIGRYDIPLEIEDEFNEWYNTIYVPNYEKVPGVIRGRRYRIVRGDYMYAAVYDFEHEKVSQSQEWLDQRDSSPVTARIRPHMRHAPGSPGVWKKTFQFHR